MTRTEIWFSILFSVMMSAAVSHLAVWAYCDFYVDGVREGSDPYGEWYLQALEEQRLRTVEAK